MDNFYLSSLVPSPHHLDPTILSILPRHPLVLSQLISHTMFFVPNQSPYDVICCISTPTFFFLLCWTIVSKTSACPALYELDFQKMLFRPLKLACRHMTWKIPIFLVISIILYNFWLYYVDWDTNTTYWVDMASWGDAMSIFDHPILAPSALIFLFLLFPLHFPLLVYTLLYCLAP
jgi:hypothetical protein